ncbi:MAG: bifunctional nicotinamidase/pyrazinamidase [Candidatus Puniceispirillaceae bacterium]
MPQAVNATLIIDVQNDFCLGGALAVQQGDQVVDPCNQLIAQSDLCVLTQDWHPAGHSSFASSHDADPFTTTQMAYGPQTLWPDHCVQGSAGAAFHPALNTDPAQLILRKGMNAAIDSYSAFFENDQTTATGLAGWLRAHGVTHLIMAGLATDFCVAWSALDARKEGFEVSLILPACRAIDLDGSLDAALSSLQQAGVHIHESLAL